MNYVIKTLKLIGVLNVIFILFNGSYQISSEYLTNVTMIIILLGLLVISFIKDIFDFVGIKVLNKPLYHFLRLVSIIVAGILSSLIILIPKLIFIESNHLDSLHIKFTARITRIWSKEELSLYLDNLITNRGVSQIISDTDQMLLVETSNSIAELKESFNTLITERLASLNPEVSKVIETVTVINNNTSFWTSENILLVVVVSAITVIAIAGIGYLTYNSLYTSTDSGTAENVSGTAENVSGTAVSDEEIIQLMEELSNQSADDVNAQIVRIETMLGNQRRALEQRIMETEARLSSQTAGLSEELTGQMNLSLRGFTEVNSRINEVCNKLKELKVATIGDSAVINVSQPLLENLNKQVARVNILNGHIKELYAKSKLDHAMASRISRNLLDLGTEYRESTAQAEKSINGLGTRVSNVENAAVKEAVSVNTYIEGAIEEIKDMILNDSELGAVRRLLENETIRDMLKDAEVKNILKGIKKG